LIWIEIEEQSVKDQKEQGPEGLKGLKDRLTNGAANAVSVEIGPHFNFSGDTQNIRVTWGKEKKKSQEVTVEVPTIHVNEQMSGDARMALLTAVKGARMNADKGERPLVLLSSPLNEKESRLYTLATGMGIKANQIRFWKTDSSEPNGSRTEALEVGRDLSEFVVQTGRVHELWLALTDLQAEINGKVSSAARTRDEVSQGAWTGDERVKEVGRKKSVVSDIIAQVGGGAPWNKEALVIWFKEKRSDMTGKNTLGQAKLQHFMGGEFAGDVVKYAGFTNVVVAGAVTGSRRQNILDRLALVSSVATVTDLTQERMDKAKADLMAQYAFWAEPQAGSWVHVGGRSGHLEPLAAMGLSVAYMEEEGNGQGRRRVDFVDYNDSIRGVYERVEVKVPHTRKALVALVLSGFNLEGGKIVYWPSEGARVIGRNLDDWVEEVAKSFWKHQGGAKGGKGGADFWNKVKEEWDGWLKAFLKNNIDESGQKQDAKAVKDRPMLKSVAVGANLNAVWEWYFGKKGNKLKVGSYEKDVEKVAKTVRGVQ
jgi:hypothetical protein